MFTNLWDSSQAFRDFNLFRVLPGHTDVAPELDIKSTMLTERKMGRRNLLPQVLGPTFSETACESFFRQNPNVLATPGDFFLSKFYQYLILSIRIICEEPVTHERVALTFPLYRHLTSVLGQLPKQLTAPEVLLRFDLAKFQDDLEHATQETKALRGVVDSMRDRLEIAFGQQPGSAASRRKQRELEDRVKFRGLLMTHYKLTCKGRGSIKQIWATAKVARPVFYAWLRGEYAEETETATNIENAIRSLIQTAQKVY